MSLLLSYKFIFPTLSEFFGKRTIFKSFDKEGKIISYPFKNFKEQTFSSAKIFALLKASKIVCPSIKNP